MSDDNLDNLVIGNITVIQNDPVTDRPQVPAHPPVTSHPWNVVLPRTPEPQATPTPRYRLTVRHQNTVRDGSDELVSCRAECQSREQLLDLSAQFEAINYDFISLELIEPPPT